MVQGMDWVWLLVKCRAMATDRLFGSARYMAYSMWVGIHFN